MKCFLCIDLFEFHNLTFTSQNMNSCNLSTTNLDDKFLTKINSVLELKSDVICLQDIRLSNKRGILENFLNHNQHGSYILYENSSKDSRGVCILIKRSLDVQVNKQYCDIHENVLLLKLSRHNYSFVIGSIYGPTDAKNPIFINELFS